MLPPLPPLIKPLPGEAVALGGSGTFVGAPGIFLAAPGTVPEKVDGGGALGSVVPCGAPTPVPPPSGPPVAPETADGGLGATGGFGERSGVVIVGRLLATIGWAAAGPPRCTVLPANIRPPVPVLELSTFVALVPATFGMTLFSIFGARSDFLLRAVGVFCVSRLAPVSWFTAPRNTCPALGRLRRLWLPATDVVSPRLPVVAYLPLSYFFATYLFLSMAE